MMPDERSFRRMLSSSERGELGFWPTTLSAVVATLIVTALIAITDERIARPTAEGFLQGYYEQAVPAAERDHAWNMLAVSLQENPKRHPEGRKTYDDWFGQWQRVQVEQVVSVAGEPNRFEANLTYIEGDRPRFSAAQDGIPIVLPIADQEESLPQLRAGRHQDRGQLRERNE
jgi:hypothetical protein